MIDERVESLFPHDSFREDQDKVLEACLDAFDNGYKNVVIDAPVGSGKSSLCTSLLRFADNGFYTTPQKSLRQQVSNDEDLQPHLENLKARKDYHCQLTNEDSKSCSIYQSEEKSCAEQGPACNYWGRKNSVMNSDIAVITFSMLVVDGMLPTFANDTQISFEDRDMVVVDEAQGLHQQVIQMHAGVDVTPYGIPSGVFQNVTSSASFNAELYKDVSSEVNQLLSNCLDYTKGLEVFDMSPAQKRCHRLAENIKRINDDVANDRQWTVEVERKRYGNDYRKVLHLRPTVVSGFLKNSVWNRGNKRVISTATLPQRNHPESWLRKVGLDPDNTQIISVDMKFPVENRPVIKDKMVSRMSGGREDDNWASIMATLNEIVKENNGEKGICHTASYGRSERIEDSINKTEHPYLHDNIYRHEQDEDAEEVVQEWQEGDKALILSPSMMEGVDLKGNMARFNILLKVPYPQRDNRTSYLIEETDYGWNEYFSRAAVRTAQAYGRTIRSKDDHANFYVLDEDYDRLKKKTTLPSWLTEAEQYEKVNRRSLLDY